MTKQKLSYLSNIEIFRDLNKGDLEKMDRQITMISCGPGRLLHMPHDSGEVLYFVVSGRVQLYRLSLSGKKLVISTLSSGSFFGEMSLVGQGMHNTFAESVDQCLLCVMNRADVERLMQDRPLVAVRFAKILGSRLSQMESRLEEIAFRSVPSRLALLLLRSADEQGQGMEVQGFSHQDLSEMVGSYRETVTQTLNAFKSEGMVDIGRKHIRLLDRGRLELVAEM